jgi:hypothetical protein
MAHMDRHDNLGASLAAPLLVLLAMAMAGPALAKSRGGSAEERKRTAVEMCARELKSREQGKNVRVDRTIRSDQRKDTVSWEGYMTVQRSGRDRSVRLSCAVSFDGKNRITRFETSGGGGSSGGGGGSDQASRACWSEAERKGYDVADVKDTSEAGGSGRLVILRVGGRKELLCLYRGRAALYRPA